MLTRAIVSLLLVLITPGLARASGQYSHVLMSVAKHTCTTISPRTGWLARSPETQLRRDPCNVVSDLAWAGPRARTSHVHLHACRQGLQSSGWVTARPPKP